jgi:hypothetical protein
VGAEGGAEGGGEDVPAGVQEGGDGAEGDGEVPEGADGPAGGELPGVVGAVAGRRGDAGRAQEPDGGVVAQGRDAEAGGPGEPADREPPGRGVRVGASARAGGPGRGPEIMVDAPTMEPQAT